MMYDQPGGDNANIVLQLQKAYVRRTYLIKLFFHMLFSECLLWNALKFYQVGGGLKKEKFRFKPSEISLQNIIIIRLKFVKGKLLCERTRSRFLGEKHRENTIFQLYCSMAVVVEKTFTKKHLPKHKRKISTLQINSVSHT